VRRREFIALLGSAAAIRPFGARAERPLERILYFTYSAGYRHDVIPVCTENLNPNVLTMKSAQYGARIYDAGLLNLARDRRIFVQ
jgi:hypothetical protein